MSSRQFDHGSNGSSGLPPTLIENPLVHPESGVARVTIGCGVGAGINPTMGVTLVSSGSQTNSWLATAEAMVMPDLTMVFQAGGGGYPGSSPLLVTIHPAVTQSNKELSRLRRMFRLRDLNRQITEYAGLEEDWDGYGGVPARPDSVKGATAFLNRMPDDVKMPEPQIASNGEVGLYWNDGQVYADVSFPAAQRISFYAKNNRGGEVEVTNLNFSDGTVLGPLFAILKGH